MSASTRAAFTPARVVALVLIVLVALALALPRLAGASDPVSVPAGAIAGDLELQSCTYPTEDGEYDAECGTLVVRENPADPESPLIALPVVRIPARSANPGEPIFWLQGGPGQSNQEVDIANRFVDDHDFVLVGYRGIDGSVRLECPEVESALKRSSDFLAASSLRAYSEAHRACAERFRDEGVDVTRYGLVQQVDDIEVARRALGYDRINLLSESAGTRTAMIYAWRHPDSIHRSVMIAVNPPGNYLWDPATTVEMIARYGELCAEDDACSSRTDDLVATFRETALPDRWLFLPIKDQNVRIVSMFGMMETTSNAAPASGPAVIDAWLAASEGDPSGLWFASVFGDLLFPELFVRGEYAAAASADNEAARAYFSRFGPEQESSIAYAATALGWGGGRTVETWPEAAEVNRYTTVRPSDVETLLINGELDFATPPQIATEQLLPSLSKGHEVVLPGFGHVSSFYTEQSEAGTHLVTTFFDTGRVDTSRYRPQSVDFTPPTTHSSTAKTVLGLLLGLSALMVVSLLGMALWQRKRGRFGAVAGALLRAPYAVVLGFGGWCLGALVVLTALPTVNLGNELLAVLASVPVAVGVYLAWVHQDWRAETKRLGLGVVLVAALIGAWLGFYAMGGPLALVTTVVAAVAAANLGLIGYDITRDLADRRAIPADAEPPAPQGVPG
jgi:pimeloyl-ACP methyl ester carboxylesterase